MTDKELRRLGRQDLLQMLVAQTKEAAALETAMAEKMEEISGLEESLERLKGKLDEKDSGRRTKQFPGKPGRKGRYDRSAENTAE